YGGGQFGVGHDAEGDAVVTTLMLADQILEGGQLQPVCHRITSKRPVTVVAPSATKRSSSLSPERSPSIVACWAGWSSDVYRKRAEACGLAPSPAAAATWVSHSDWRRACTSTPPRPAATAQPRSHWLGFQSRAAAA